jgi:hypothetical protein
MERQDMQRIIEMLAKMDADRKTNQAKMDADRKAWREEMPPGEKRWTPT